ncbi:MAG: endonuclease/exonuclease/phosphatase family protein [Sandaracinus sp.]|nr:endonuclease/exonuclease/phosphatase family protein [Sandaracinus sp.]
MTDIRVLSWNVRMQDFGKRADAVIDAILGDRPDIVTLQEIHNDQADAVLETLAAADLHGHFFGDTKGRRPRHGVLVAAKHPVTARVGWSRKAKYPALFGRARVEWPDLPGDADGIDVFTAHIPNGSSNGWVKVEHMQILGVALQRAPDAPRLLTGDFNEPQQFRSNGQIVGFASDLRGDGGVRVSGKYRKNTDEPKPRADWGRAVRDVLSPSAHGLTNVIEAKHPMVPTPVTHVVSGKHPRCFDHGFASRHFEVVESGYHHEWRTNGSSDHSALWFVVCPREVGPLNTWAE